MREHHRQSVAHALRGLPGQRGHVPHVRVRKRDRQKMHRPLHTRNHSLRHTVIHLRHARGPFQFRVPVGLAAMRLPPLFDPPLHRGILAREPELGHQPLVHAARGMTLLARQTQIRGRPLVSRPRVLARHQGPRRGPAAGGRRRAVPRRVFDHGRTRDAQLPGYPRVIRSLSFELPDTLLNTHRCRHSFPHRETERMVDRHSGIYQETNGTGALAPHRTAPAPYRLHRPE